MLQIILLQFSGSEFRDESHRAKSKVSAEGFLLEAPGGEAALSLAAFRGHPPASGCGRITPVSALVFTSPS